MALMEGSLQCVPRPLTDAHSILWPEILMPKASADILSFEAIPKIIL